MPAPPKRSTRSRGWCFTINNYNDEHIQVCQTAPCQYIVYGEEVGESGTPHLQGYIHFKNAVTAGHVKAILTSQAHIEVRKGSIEQAVLYCKKDGKVFEKGTLRVTNKWNDIVQLAESGDMDTLKDEYPSIYVLHKAKLESLMCPEIKPFEDDPKNHFEWWYGPTGTGKSKTMWATYPQHYDKLLNKWWDGYKYDKVVVIEEADPKRCEHMATFFKRWMDHYPFRAEIKNGHLNNIRPDKIIVLSNYTIKECFPNQQDWEPLLRRFKVVHFPFRIEGSVSPMEVTIDRAEPIPVPSVDPRYLLPEPTEFGTPLNIENFSTDELTSLLFDME